MRYLLAALCAGVIGATAGCGDDDPSASSSGASTGAGGGAASSAATGTGGGGGAGGTGGGPGACGAVATPFDGIAPTNELHVATTGSDASGDGSEATPYATIEHAAASATPGTSIVVHPGTYAGDMYIADLAGQPDAPIWIGGVPGEPRPVIEGGGEAMHFTRARWLELHDLEIRQMAANGLNCDDGAEYDNPEASAFVVFRRLFIHDVGDGGNQDCLKLSGLNDYWVVESEMAVCGGSGAGSAIDHVGCHRGVIAGNHIHDLTGNGIQCKGGSEDIEIRWNRFSSAGGRPINMGGSTGFEFFRPPLSTTAPNVEARDIRVLANVIEGGDCAAAFVGCVDCVFQANTIIDPGNWFLRVLQETVSDATYEFLPAQNGTVASNIFYFNRASLSGEDVNVGAGTSAGTFVFQSNLWYAHDDPAASAPMTLPAPETGGIVGQDPGFTNAAQGDYHIGPASPAAGAGVAFAGLTGDLDGACYAMPPSIGALEAR